MMIEYFENCSQQIQTQACCKIHVNIIAPTLHQAIAVEIAIQVEHVIDVLIQILFFFFCYCCCCYLLWLPAIPDSMADILKEKEEVQDFLKNLGIEYRYSCYGEKNPEGCQLLGDYLSQIQKDFNKANKVFKENCETRNHGRSCSSYALHLLNGKGVERNYPSSLEYFSKACELDDATGCDHAGKLLTNCEPTISKHIQLDAKRGLAYLERGCNLQSTAQLFESSESCYAAAFMHAVGLVGIGKNETKAIEFGTRSCELGQLRACKLMSQLYARKGDQTMAKQFEARSKMLEKQLRETAPIEMQRS